MLLNKNILNICLCQFAKCPSNILLIDDKNDNEIVLYVSGKRYGHILIDNFHTYKVYLHAHLDIYREQDDLYSLSSLNHEDLIFPEDCFGLTKIKSHHHKLSYRYVNRLPIYGEIDDNKFCISQDDYFRIKMEKFISVSK